MVGEERIGPAVVVGVAESDSPRRYPKLQSGNRASPIDCLRERSDGFGDDMQSSFSP